MGNLKSKITVSQAALQMEGKFQCSLLERILSSFPLVYLYSIIQISGQSDLLCSSSLRRTIRRSWSFSEWEEQQNSSKLLVRFMELLSVQVQKE